MLLAAFVVAVGYNIIWIKINQQFIVFVKYRIIRLFVDNNIISAAVSIRAVKATKVDCVL